MEIGRKDILWNYAATFLKIASSILLLPFILRMMPPEMVGIWSVFMTITAFTGLLDFGFNPSFTRNVTYVFSGVSTLKSNGFESSIAEDNTIDYGLLKGVISVMRWFYLRMAVILFLLLTTLGTYYIHILLENYNGEKKEVYMAWALLCLINTYNLYTLYYDSLLQGKGLIKLSKQIVIFGQSAYLITGILLLIFGYGLVAIVLAQATSVIIIRWVSYRSFFKVEIVQKLTQAVIRPRKDILKAIYPNAIKIGLTSLGSFMVQRSAMIIGSFYLTLENIAAYGITLQLLSIVAGLATIYTSTYQPKIAQMRVVQNSRAIKQIYLKGQIVLFLTFLVGGASLLLFGERAFELIGSKTHLIPSSLLTVAIVIGFLENNHAVAGGILLSKNEVPFFKAALVSGGLTLVILVVLFNFVNIGLWPMIVAPGIAQVLYQNWKWPLVVKMELAITNRDFGKALKEFFRFKVP